MEQNLRDTKNDGYAPKQESKKRKTAQEGTGGTAQKDGKKYHNTVLAKTNIIGPVGESGGKN